MTPALKMSSADKALSPASPGSAMPLAGLALEDELAAIARMPRLADPTGPQPDCPPIAPAAAPLPPSPPPSIPPTTARRPALRTAVGAIALGLTGISAHVLIPWPDHDGAPLAAPAAQAATPTPRPSAIASGDQEPSPEKIANKGQAPAMDHTRSIGEPPAPRPEAPAIPIRHHPQTLPTNPILDNAYATLQRSDLTAASQGYQQVLQGDPHNSDALLGLASISLQTGQVDQARALYHRILEANPDHPEALANLSTLDHDAPPEAIESRLQGALAHQPPAPSLYFALGNTYARQGRWAEAQEAYFNAIAGEENNPDYLCNLAISLDHLRQSRLSRHYYQAALKAAEQHMANFDRGQIRQRLQEIPAP